MNSSRTTRPGGLIEKSDVASLLSVLALGLVVALGSGSALWTLFAMAVLALSVATAVHHAEVIAMRVGATRGTLVLALAVTVI